MKQQVSQIIEFDLIDDISLILNSRQVILGSKIFKTPIIEFDIKKGKKEFIDQLRSDNKNMYVLGVSKAVMAQQGVYANMKFVYELFPEKQLQTIISSFQYEGIKIKRVQSGFKAIKKATQPYMQLSKSVVNIDFDSYFTTITHTLDGVVQNVSKKNIGIESIYMAVAQQLEVDISSAVKLVKAFGNIPPENIVDNRIISSRFNKETGLYKDFDKKQLSSVITQVVNSIYEHIYEDVNISKESNPLFLFSGQLSGLKGFVEYSKTTLDINNVKTYKSNIVGINDYDAFVTSGALAKTRKVSTEDAKQQPKAQIISLFNRVKRLYNYI
ncbi:MAG: hypothetical protein DRP42_02010 [Tenericutes bacterium]|nr:MAG: hypothetical protein DRP42_02010 [Mycoplasmatota bacterium]